MSEIAQFKHVGSSGSHRICWDKDMMNADGQLSGYIRVSDWVDVAFPARTDEAAIPEEVAQLDAKLEELKVDFAKKVNAIEEAKQNLLSLTQDDHRIEECQP
jgi:hypothetical protein